MDQNNIFLEALHSLIFYGFRIERVSIPISTYNSSPNMLQFVPYASWEMKELESVMEDSWLFNFLLCSEGSAGNCSNLLMKVYRLPFVNGNNRNETHVYAL